MTNNNKARTKEGSPKTKEKEPPQAPPKEGMYLAGYEMLGVGEMEGGRNQA